MTAGSRPSVLVLDVNETLSDTAPLADRFAEVGAPGFLAAEWFAGVLRDGFALTIGGASAPFADIGADGLRTVLAGHALDRPMDEAVTHLLTGFSGLDVHADVRPGITRLAGLGLRLTTLSNGSVGVAESLLERAGLDHHVEALMSVEEAGTWKPAHAAYDYACARLGVEPDEAMLVAVHPWDVDGAARAGLATCWIDRRGTAYPSRFLAPDLVASGLDDLARQLS